MSALRIIINRCLISRYISHYIQINGRDFRVYVLAVLSNLCANFTFFLPNFGTNDSIRNYDFLTIYHIRAYRNNRFYRLEFFSELLLLVTKM